MCDTWSYILQMIFNAYKDWHQSDWTWRFTLWLFNMENGLCLDGLPIKHADFPWLHRGESPSPNWVMVWSTMVHWYLQVGDKPIYCWLVGTGTWLDYDVPIILGMEYSSQLTKSIIFQRGRLNHQPEHNYYYILSLLLFIAGIIVHDYLCYYHYWYITV